MIYLLAISALSNVNPVSKARCMSVYRQAKKAETSESTLRDPLGAEEPQLKRPRTSMPDIKNDDNGGGLAGLLSGYGTSDDDDDDDDDST